MKTKSEDPVVKKGVGLEAKEFGNEIFYKISDVNRLSPFFMSIVSDSNHWMFIASNGGISAGRKDANHALFPYYTEDKITASVENTGSKTILRVLKKEEVFVWEPFSERSEDQFNLTRNLYKSKYGNKIIFEEINQDLGLCFSYEWNSSNLYGFVRKSKLINLTRDDITIHLLDGLQNILPYGVGSELQNLTSNLADAYKRSELHTETGLGIFSLSAIIVDKAEPSEALKANVVWSVGIKNAVHLLSVNQLHNFRENGIVFNEEDIKGQKGAYFISSETVFSSQEEKEWIIVANVNNNHAAVVQLIDSLQNDKGLYEKVIADVELGTENLLKLCDSADALQFTADGLRDSRHFSNVLFNIMRGGIFDNNYAIEKLDFLNYLRRANRYLFNDIGTQLQYIPDLFSLNELKELAVNIGNIDFIRLAIQYLPLKFSRRHGDPSRPWNRFSINTRSELDGSKILDYEGNWRDIFQNWEALAHSYPQFTEGMIFKFLNASTFDGYNPYRIIKDGFDWEVIEPDNPWSYIGYWGDHQLIYLLKFLEFIESHQPSVLHNLFDKDYFVYANVPYKIKSYEDILKNPKDTIHFDIESDKNIRQKCEQNGSDGALLGSLISEIHHVNFIEKILATILAKIANFIPEAGIWMNTQRPEWNDANNALVGNGVSMVTLYYLRRFLTFFSKILSGTAIKEVEISSELYACLYTIAHNLDQSKSLLSGSISDENRKKIMDINGEAASHFRNSIYLGGFSGNKSTVELQWILHFFETATQFMEHSIKVNKREDHLYHAYNLMNANQDGISITHLSEMLEGQVAVLSSGYLSAEESLELLNVLKESALYRKDQNSYILYPNKNLPGFLQKNYIPQQLVLKSALLIKLVNDSNVQLIEKDCKNGYHFNGNFKNAHDVVMALNEFNNTEYQLLAEKDNNLILDIFEEVFNHKEFTGRSGTFFGYEGLGSIYWHMVSKLQLAVLETCMNAIDIKASKATVKGLTDHYYEINEGIGVHKPPELYGAFPTDPYSHTPLGKGAQQPGMTGQVKEDILCRFGELGVFVRDSKIYFQPFLLRKKEFLSGAKEVKYTDVLSKAHHVILDKKSLCFTYCQVPVIYKISQEKRMVIFYTDGKCETRDELNLDARNSKMIFGREGVVEKIEVSITENDLIA